MPLLLLLLLPLPLHAPRDGEPGGSSPGSTDISAKSPNLP